LRKEVLEAQEEVQVEATEQQNFRGKFQNQMKETVQEEEDTETKTKDNIAEEIPGEGKELLNVNIVEELSDKETNE
jgi:hypothetical protein